MELCGTGTPEGQRRLDELLRALQGALRLAMEAGPAASEDPAFHAQLERAYQAYDGWIAEVEAANAFTCGRGCAACCHDNPHGVAGVEILRLRRALAAQGRLERVTAEAVEAAAAFQEQVGARGGRSAMEGQRALHRPCPLLDASGACSAYPARPLACRMFHALTPPAWCDPAHPDFERRQNPHLLPPRVCLQLLGAISRCLGLPASTTLWEGLATLREPG